MSDVTKTQAIRAFLLSNTHPDLAALYNQSLEVQVSVAQDGGTRVEGEFKGRQYGAWTDGRALPGGRRYEWKPFRIPLNANSEPIDNDGPMNFDLSAHVEAIGLTGWDFKSRVSKWVGFDYDSLTGHAEGHRGKLTDAELDVVKRKAMDISWVTVRKSTSGNGIHLYVFLPDISTKNHTEHSALARSVLGQMSALSGFDFRGKVDATGGNMWVFHRKMRGTDGLALIKQGEVLRDIPPDWRDHLPVVTGQQNRTLPQLIVTEDTRSDKDRLFDELTGQQVSVGLDADHQKLLDFLRVNRLAWSWQPDHHMLTVHTASLKRAHTELGLKGAFETTSKGSNPGADINAFAFPLRNGAWVVRRYGNLGPGSEAPTWSKDRAGYLRCYLNREPDLLDVAKAGGATEHETGGFSFSTAADAASAASALGASVVLPENPIGLLTRPSRLRKHRDGRLIVDVERKSTDADNAMPGWNQGPKVWSKIYDTAAEPTGGFEEVGNYDTVIRHMVTERGKDAGWAVCSDGRWREEAKGNTEAALVHLGVKKSDITNVIGSCVLRPWTLIRVPFSAEYPGDRMWNRGAPRLKFTPSVDLDRLQYPTWTRILDHLGDGLTDGVQMDPWCRANGIATGGDYLKCWIASLIQFPLKPLPYLFLYSREQNTGKSILAEALERIICDGVMRAKQALTSQGGFNGELESMILCIVEEGALKGVKGAYEKIKEWVNSPTILIHPKGATAYQAANTSHWIQTSNDPEGCPIDPQDSRITMIRVAPLDPAEIIPKEEMFRRLDKEAPDFLAAILALEIPATQDRLNVPVVETEEKYAARYRGQTPLQMFLAEHTRPAPGATIKVSEFYQKIYEWLDDDGKLELTKRRIQADMPTEYPRGRRSQDSQWVFGNLAWSDAPPTPVRPRLALRGEVLRPLDELRRAGMVPHSTSRE